MSHRHYCDFAGHEWICEGYAVRLFATVGELTPCVCLQHGVSMDGGDHSECIVELLACPGHRKEQLQQMREIGTSDITPDELDSERIMATNENGELSIGFCVWCNQDFYTIAEVGDHNADGMLACPVFQQFLREERAGAQPTKEVEAEDPQK